MSKFNKLFALAQKSATEQKATLTHKAEGEGTITLTLKGPLKSFDAAGYRTLAKSVGGSIKGKGEILEAVGTFGGTLSGDKAPGFVDVMVGADDADAAPAPANRLNGKAAPAAA